MEIVLLGTGAADGWPNAFCRCASCRDAAARGNHRGQTAALLDDSLLIDCGPEIPAAAVRHGRTLAGVRHLVVTHSHSDHLGPQALLSRSWVEVGAGGEAPGELEVIGPAAALDVCRPWVGPDDPVRFTPVAPGDRLAVRGRDRGRRDGGGHDGGGHDGGGYDVRVLPARHRVFDDEDCVLYDVTGPDGSRILWATDTGPWAREWFAAVAGARFDAVFLEETLGDREEISDAHLGLTRFGEMVRALREVVAVTDATEVVAVHLGHHNPPEDELAARLQVHGARPARDGEVLRLRPARPR